MYKFLLGFLRKGFGTATSAVSGAASIGSNLSLSTLFTAQAILRVALVGSGIAFLGGIIMALPDAGPFPTFIASFVYFVIDCLYVFNAIFPVDTFLQVLNLMVHVGIASLVGVFGMWVWNKAVYLAR